MTETLAGLTHRGELIVIGVDPEPLHVSLLATAPGWAQDLRHAFGTAREVEETLHFAALTGVRPMIEEVPLTDAQSAVERMLSGQARFRMVLTTGR